MDGNYMDDFIPKDNPYKNILLVILNEIKGFSSSIEFIEMDREDKTLNYVVMGAFNRYFEQLLKDNKKGILKDNEKNDLESCYKFLDELANSEHPDGPTLLTCGVYDYFLHGEISDIIFSKVSGKTKLLFEEWRRTQ
jgi:hypothetical protein